MIDVHVDETNVTTASGVALRCVWSGCVLGSVCGQAVCWGLCVARLCVGVCVWYVWSVSSCWMEMSYVKVAVRV